MVDVTRLHWVHMSLLMRAWMTWQIVAKVTLTKVAKVTLSKVVELAFRTADITA